VILTRVSADGTGAITSTKVNLPEALTSGVHTLVATGESSGTHVATLMYVRAKAPWLTPASYSLKAGTILGFVAGGLGASQSVTVSLEPAAKTADGNAQDRSKLSPATTLTHLTTDRVGNTSWANVPIPMVRPGTYSVVAEAGDRATADVVIVPLSPVAELSPWSGPAGASVTLNVRGFASNEPIQVFLGQSNQPTLSLNADQYGNAWGAGPVKIPYDAGAGSLPIRLVGTSSTAEVTAKFTVQSAKPWLELTAYSGPPGTPVSFSGGGWASGERVTFHQGDAGGPIVGESQADGYGYLQLGGTASAGAGTSTNDTATSITFTAVGDRSRASASASFQVINPFVNVPPELRNPHP
jgi:hypothetical protein